MLVFMYIGLCMHITMYLYTGIFIYLYTGMYSIYHMLCVDVCVYIFMIHVYIIYVHTST